MAGLMRSTPLRRKTPLRAKPKQWVKPERRIVLVRSTLPVRRAVMATDFAPAAPVPKHEYIRSPALLRACRDLACQHCSRSGIGAGVVAAHSNWTPHHKGGAIKADDNRVAALCWICHLSVDQGSRLSHEQRKRLWWPAHVKTVRLLIEREKWPKHIPVPDVASCPWELACA